MHTSAKSSVYKRHAVVGPGGMGCPCCAPRSGRRRLANVRTYLRRQGGKREWASFLREQDRGLLAELHSAQVEKREAEYAAMYEWVRKELAAQDEYEEDRRRRVRMNDQWLKRLGEGTLVWQPERRESWTLCRVCYSEPDAWYDGDGPDWYTSTLAQITLSRELFAWVVTDYPSPDDDSAHRIIPLMDTSLEVLQTTLMVKHILTNT